MIAGKINQQGYLRHCNTVTLFVNMLFHLSLLIILFRGRHNINNSGVSHEFIVIAILNNVLLIKNKLLTSEGVPMGTAGSCMFGMHNIITQL